MAGTTFSEWQLTEVMIFGQLAATNVATRMIQNLTLLQTKN